MKRERAGKARREDLREVGEGEAEGFGGSEMKEKGRRRKNKGLDGGEN